MRKINLKDARSQLEELKRLQGKKDTISNVVALIESSGQISATLYRGLPKSGKLITKTFPSLRDLLEFPGITDETGLLLDDTPHLHIDFVPFTTGSKRGLDTRVSLKQALAAQGFQGGTRGDTEWSQWVRSEKEQLSLVMERHGIEWEDKGTHDKHLSVLDYKKEQRAKEIAVLETVKAEKENQVESQERRLKELAPAVKNMERLAADFSANPEEILPEPGTLETGRAYREKKAKPLLAQIVKVLRSLYLAYVELRGKFERLQGDYGRVRESNIRLSDRLQEVKLENKAMRQVSADYERVKRAFGPEQVDRILEAAYQQEHAEKERKRAAKSKIRIDAR